VTRSVIAALAFSLLLAVSALAQEYGRTDAGDLKLFAKNTQPISGSFQIGTGGGSKLFGATAGGTLVADRLWFFASAAKNDNVLTNRFGSLALPAAAARSFDGKTMAQLTDRQSLTAVIGSSHTDAAPFGKVSSSVFAMNYTGIVSPSAFFTVSVSQRHAGVQQP
jgi:hypothetical protein